MIGLLLIIIGVLLAVTLHFLLGLVLIIAGCSMILVAGGLRV